LRSTASCRSSSGHSPSPAPTGAGSSRHKLQTRSSCVLYSSVQNVVLFIVITILVCYRILIRNQHYYCTTAIHATF
jgi:hypothetical protein